MTSIHSHFKANSGIKVIGRNFIEVFQETAEKLEEEAKNSPKAGDIEWLLQGTLYPDVIESISFKGNITWCPKTRFICAGALSQMSLAPGFGIPATC